jgi:hypothetical protein
MNVKEEFRALVKRCNGAHGHFGTSGLGRKSGDCGQLMSCMLKMTVEVAKP